jgi:hypothetical protein
MPIALRDCHARRPALAPLVGMEVRAESSAHLMASLQTAYALRVSRRPVRVRLPARGGGMRALIPTSDPESAAGGGLATSCIADGAKPNIRFDVRVRCAASANPAE